MEAIVLSYDLPANETGWRAPLRHASMFFTGKHCKFSGLWSVLSQRNIGSRTGVGSPFQAPIVLQPHFSPALAWAFALIHLLAFIVVLSQLASLAKAALATAVVMSAALAMRRHLLFLGASIVALTLKSDGTFLVRLADSEVEKGELLPGAFVHPQLTVLVFRLSQKKRRRALLLTPDNVDPEAFRRLRVRLRV